MNLYAAHSMKRQIMRVLARTTACSLLLMLPACGIPPLRQAAPAPALPTSFSANYGPEVSVAPPTNCGEACSGTSAQVGIEEFFNDPILTDLIHYALSNNQELQILAQEIEIANNEVLTRRGAIFPTVDIGGRAGLEKPSLYTPQGAVEEQLEVLPGKPFPDPLPNFLVAADLSWQVDIWRQLRNARDAASLRFLGTIEGRNYIVTRLVAEIAENYYGLLALDKRLEILDQTIALQEKSLELSKAKKEAGRGTELPIQRFQAEVRKNQSTKLIVRQQIIEVENRINFLLGRYPQPVVRRSVDFFDVNLNAPMLGVPAQLLLNRPDIREAERKLEAAGLDVQVARANFFPRLDISAGIGYEAFNLKYLFNTPEALVYNLAGNLAAPLINKAAIKAEYKTANAVQLQRIYDYQRIVLNAFAEVVNRISRAENYRRSILLKQQQLTSLDESVKSATLLFQNARVEYIEVLFAQRDLLDARVEVVETKREQLAAIVNAYQALGGGNVFSNAACNSLPLPQATIEHPEFLFPPSAPQEPAQLESN